MRDVVRAHGEELHFEELFKLNAWPRDVTVVAVWSKVGRVGALVARGWFIGEYHVNCLARDAVWAIKEHRNAIHLDIDESVWRQCIGGAQGFREAPRAIENAGHCVAHPFNDGHAEPDILVESHARGVRAASSETKRNRRLGAAVSIQSVEIYEKFAMGTTVATAVGFPRLLPTRPPICEQ